MGYNLEAVFFDMDGVLIDTLWLMKKTYSDVASELGLNSPSEKSIIEILSLPPQKATKSLFAGNAESANGLFNRFWSNNLKESTPYPGIVELLKNLSSKGIIMGIVTSRNGSDTLTMLSTAGIGSLMQVIVTWGQYRVAKPSPRCIQVALEATNVHSIRSAYIGDQPNDIYAARNAGVLPVGAAWGQHVNENGLRTAGASVVAKTPIDILGLFNISH